MAKNFNNKYKNLVQAREETPKDLGFGTNITSEESRLINKDGSFNVKRIGDSFLNSVNWYHRLITMSWWAFLATVFLFYSFLNLIFACVYVIIGVDYLAGMNVGQSLHPFWEAFFFSAQTLTTVGYGRVSPTGFLTNGVAAFEALVGLLLIALATGMLYGRFSRSLPRIRFSKNLVISPYMDINGAMFRIIHERDNELIDLVVEVSLSCLEELPNGKKVRMYYPLELERDRVNFFPLNWTIVHPITQDSPLYGMSEAEMKEKDSEFLIMIKAIDDTFMQQVHVRYSYHHEEVVYGAKFNPLFDSGNAQQIHVNISDLDDYREASLNN
jgi:inward rectifier potassium channel